MADFMSELIYFITCEEVVTAKFLQVMCTRGVHSFGGVVAVNCSQLLWTEFVFSIELRKKSSGNTGNRKEYLLCSYSSNRSFVYANLVPRARVLNRLISELLAGCPNRHRRLLRIALEMLNDK